MKNPLALKAGERLPLKVYYKGNPLSGAKIYGEGYSSQKLKTDKDGIVEVLLNDSKHHRIGVLHKIQLENDPDSDYLVRTANINFETE